MYTISYDTGDGPFGYVGEVICDSRTITSLIQIFETSKTPYKVSISRFGYLQPNQCNLADGKCKYWKKPEYKFSGE